MSSLIPGHKTFKAVKFLITGPMILVMLLVINVMTSPGHWWIQWPALGIGIAWFTSLMRVIRSVIVVGGLAALAFLAYRHYTKQNVSIPSQLV